VRAALVLADGASPSSLVAAGCPPSEECGWREHDAAAIAALYAEGAFWQQHPFREPEPDYLARVFAEEESAQCRFGTPIVDGDQAAVSWSAQARLGDGGAEGSGGTVLAAF
jgi:SnoaL-like domain